MPGTAGIMVPPPGYLAGVREICDRYGIVLIADEVMAGFGRTGKWFAIEHFDVVPDLITFAKGVTSGYVPLGGVAISETIAATFADRAYPGGLTYSGHPLAAAAAVATINAMEDEGMVANAARIGIGSPRPRPAEIWRHVIRRSARSADSACSGRSNWSPTGDAGTVGPLWRFQPRDERRHRACKSGGLLPFANFNRIHAVPPCNVTDAEIAEGLAILDSALDIADSYL